MNGLSSVVAFAYILYCANGRKSEIIYADEETTPDGKRRLVLKEHYKHWILDNYFVDENVLNKADLIINHSVIGLDNENVYDMTYDLEALVGPYVDRIGDDAVYLYDSTDPKEVELLSFLKARLPGIEGVPYESEIGRSDYGVYGNRVGDGLIISTSLDETIGFIRSLESPRIAVTYLDAAALETIKPVLVFSPDWDEIIRGNL